MIRPLRWPALCCPHCLSELLLKEDEQVCGSCGRRWPSADGVVYFGGSDPRAHVLTPEQRGSLACSAAAEGWQDALHGGLRQLNPASYRQAIGRFRVHWKYLLPIGNSVRVLDLNCGLGATSFGLATCGGAIVAADASPVQAWFVAIRARQSHVSNIQAIQLGLDLNLPFPTSTFDAVVFADGVGLGRNRAAEQQALRNAYRVLRAGGTLLFADANGLLPMTAAAWRRKGLRSPAGYVRQVRLAGFHHVRRYALLPSHLEPYFIVPLDEPAYLSFFIRTLLREADFGPQLQRRGLGSVYQLLKAGRRMIPPRPLAQLIAPLAPGVAIVASC